MITQPVEPLVKPVEPLVKPVKPAVLFALRLSPIVVDRDHSKGLQFVGGCHSLWINMVLTVAAKKLPL